MCTMPLLGADVERAKWLFERVFNIGPIKEQEITVRTQGSFCVDVLPADPRPPLLARKE